MSIETLKVENHSVKSDPEHRVLVYRYNGVFLPEHAREIIRFSNKVLASHPGLYAICDVGQMKTAPPETRKLLIDWFKTQHFPAILCFGANLATRTLTLLITSAARMLSGSVPRYVFVNSEAEAYAWVAAQAPANAAA